MTVTDRPARARLIAAARPFGPPPTTTASTGSARDSPCTDATLGPQPDRPDEVADRGAIPPRPGGAPLTPRREAVAEAARPDERRRPVRERVPPEEPERRAIALEE